MHSVTETPDLLGATPRGHYLNDFYLIGFSNKLNITSGTISRIDIWNYFESVYIKSKIYLLMTSQTEFISKLYLPQGTLKTKFNLWAIYRS